MSENVTPTQANTAKLPRLVDLQQTWFSTSDGKRVNVLDATAKEFDDFITQYVDVVSVDRAVWPDLVRWRALKFALSQGCPVAIERQAMSA